MLTQGTLKKTKYFTTVTGGATGRFCRASEIVRSQRTSVCAFPFAMGDTVRCSERGVDCAGTVRYFGCPAWAADGAVHFGLELAQPKGDGDGAQCGARYFETAPRRALYVEALRVRADAKGLSLRSKGVARV